MTNSKIDQPPKALIEALKSDQLVIFAGSGLSRRFNLPDWNGMTKQIIEEIGEESFKTLIPALDHKVLSAIEVLDKLADERPAISKFILENFNLGGREKEEFNFHRKLVDLTGKIVTTNYDNAFEKANESIVPTIYTSKYSLAQINRENKPYIFKIHGCFREPDNCIVLSEEYKTIYQGETGAEHKLKTIFTEKTILFLGFSFSDPDINLIFKSLDEAFGSNNKHFILTTEPKDFAQFKYLKTIEIPDHDDTEAFIDSCIGKISPEEIAEDFARPSDQRNEDRTTDKSTFQNTLGIIGKPSKLFTGRFTEQDKLKNLAENEEIFSVTGIGGIGKTQLVLKFLENHPKTLAKQVLWQEITDSTNFDNFLVASGFESVAASNSTDLQKFNGLVQKLNEHGLIVILDNYHDLKDRTFDRFLEFASGKLESSQVLIISRSTDRLSRFNHVELADLKESFEYAETLLKNRHEKLKFQNSDIQQICDYVRGHPLAIELALNLCESVPLDLVLGKLSKHKSGVDELSKRLFEEILSQPGTTSEEVEFLYQFSIFKGPVSKDILSQTFGNSIFFEAVNPLTQKHLIEFSGEDFSTHPLIGEFCYEHLENKHFWHEKASSILIDKRQDKFDAILESRIFHHLKGAGDVKTVSDSITTMGREYVRSGLFDSLLELLAFTIAEERPTLHYLLEGEIHRHRGNWDEALRLFEEGSTKSHAPEIAVECIFKQLEIYSSRLAPNYVQVLARAKKESEKLGSTKFLAWAKAAEFTSLSASGRHDEASAYCHEALDLSKRLDDKSDLAACYLNLGTLYQEKHFKNFSLRQAEKYINKSLQEYTSIGDLIGISTCYNWFGSIYSHPSAKKPDFDKAIKWYQESLGIRESLGNQDGIASEYLNLSSVYSNNRYKDKDFGLATDLLFKALSITTDIGDSLGRLTCLNSLGIVYSNSNNPKKDLRKAINFFHELIDSFPDSNPDKLSTYHGNLAVVYIDIKDYYNAVYHLITALAYTSTGSLNSKHSDYFYVFLRLRDVIEPLPFQKLVNQAYENIDAELRGKLVLSDLLGQPRISESSFGRNDRVKVKYNDLDELVEKKYKQVEKDIKAGKCKIVE